MNQSIVSPNPQEQAVYEQLASSFVERVQKQEQAFVKTLEPNEDYSLVHVLPDGSIISIENLGFENPDMLILDGVNDGNQNLRMLVHVYQAQLLLIKLKRETEITTQNRESKIGYQLHSTNQTQNKNNGL